jgi:hypothetical protein
VGNTTKQRKDTEWMGKNIILNKFETAKEVSREELNWEEESYQTGCSLARQEALKRLQAVEERLFKALPLGWHVIANKERTLVTRFGEITLKRRLYRDDQGKRRCLLDEVLGLSAQQLATPSLQESLVELCGQVSFRLAGKTVEKLTAGVLSTPTVYRLTEKTAKRALEKEKEDWQAVFEKGAIPLGEKKVPILFSEGDGTWIHLQQEEQEHYEIKDGIAYEGWERLPGKAERYALANKRVYCQGSEQMPFWEGASLEWSRVWDLSYPKEIVIGGDGANWIDEGVEVFRGALRQLDGFHLARACGQGWQEGKTVYKAIRAGQAEEARSLISKAILKEGKRATQSRRYVENNLEKGKDWRTQSAVEGRGLGTMEANQDKLIANRMKKRGLSWKIDGALRMAKVLQLRANGEIRPYCERQPKIRSVATQVKRGHSKSNDQQKWLEAGLPALVGPHANRPWVEKLRHMTNLSYRLN